MEFPVEIVVIIRLAGIEETHAHFVLFGTGPCIALIGITFAARPIEIGIYSFKVRTCVGAMKGTMMVNLKACLTAHEEFVNQAVSTTMLKILPQQGAVQAIVSIIPLRDASREDHFQVGSASGKASISARSCASSWRNCSACLSHVSGRGLCLSSSAISFRIA